MSEAVGGDIKRSLDSINSGTKVVNNPETLSYTFLSNSGETLDSSQFLTYPQELEGGTYSQETDYVRFRFKKYKAPFSFGVQQSASATYNSNVLNLYDDPELPTVMMYMPEDIQAAYGTQWGGKSIQSTTTNALRGGAGLASGDLNTFLGGLTNQLNPKDGNAPAAVTSLAIKGLLQALSNIGQGEGLNVNDVLGSTRSVILNPNTELLFQGFDLRTFNLQFKMVARDDKEADDIRKIIYCFKAAMLPRLDEQEGRNPQDRQSIGIGGTSKGNLIGVPDLVDIKFMHKSQYHPYLTQFKPCAITGLQVNYTPDGSYATYRDGQPVALTMNVQFSETKLVYREDVRFGGPTF